MMKFPIVPVIGLAGLPGAGKTTIAQELRRRHGFSILSRDTVKRALFSDHDVGEIVNSIAFGAMLNALPALVDLKVPVVIDGMPFSHEGQSESVELVLRDNGVLFVFVDTPIVKAQRRLSVPDPSGPVNRNPELVTRVATDFRTIPHEWLRINGTEDPSFNAETIMQAMRPGNEK